MLRVLDFLGVSYSQQRVRERLLEDVTTFHRQATNFDFYTPEQRKLIRDEVRGLVARLQQDNDGDTLGIEEYLDL